MLLLREIKMFLCTFALCDLLMFEQMHVSSYSVVALWHLHTVPLQKYETMQLVELKTVINKGVAHKGG